MSIVPDWISKEDTARALFLVLGALLTAFKDGLAWLGKLLARWMRDRQQSRKAVAIVQDFVSLGAGNLWHTVPFNGRDTMHFVGHFRVTNTTDKPLTFTRIDCTESSGSQVFHTRVLNLSKQSFDDSPVRPKSAADLRIEFGLDPAPDWIGARRLRLVLTDSVGVRRKVTATFLPLPPGSPPPS